MSTDDGGPAFPAQPIIRHPGGGDTVLNQPGMTLRDYFAAAALSRCIEIAAEFMMTEPDFESDTRGLSEMMRRAAGYAMFTADAMLAERAK